MSPTNLRCRSCGAATLLEVLSLGSTPLANSLLREDQLSEPEPVFPLEVVFCQQCALVQITETVPPEQLFRNYVYFSSFSDAAVSHARAIAQRLLAERRLGADSLVLEIASNDGYLLQNYRQAGVRVLGIDPAENIARLAEERGIPTRCDFFGLELARSLAAEGLRADVIHAHNVLAHVANLNDVVEGIALLLKPTGVAVIEVPYVKDLIDHVEFDTIYHEHLCYFSLTTLQRLFRRHELIVADVEHTAIHGGSLRVICSLGGKPSSAVRLLLDEEARWGVDEVAYYIGFAERVNQLGSTLRKELSDLKAGGARIAAYGASAKGSTLLNYFKIGAETLDYVVDRSTAKQGLFTPGTHLPIHDPRKLLEDRPDYALLLTWNFAEEILAQQAAYRNAGGLFIVPVPRVAIV